VSRFPNESPVERIEKLREEARRTREVARMVSQDRDRIAFRRYAEELEAEAARLETETHTETHEGGG